MVHPRAHRRPVRTPRPVRARLRGVRVHPASDGRLDLRGVRVHPASDGRLDLRGVRVHPRAGRPFAVRDVRVHPADGRLALVLARGTRRIVVRAQRMRGQPLRNVNRITPCSLDFTPCSL
eukprot:6308384-Pyramimonas_sp.AAC.1